MAGQGGAGGAGGTGSYTVGTLAGSGPAGAAGNTGQDGQDGNPGKAGGAGFGAGAGNSQAGGGGVGAGGDIFVAQGGILTVDGGLLSGGSVANGTGANPGGAFGTGIFLQGNETITLASTAGRMLTISDVIADQTGSGGAGTSAGIGGLDIAGTGTVKLAAQNSFVGGITIQSGTLDLAALDAAGSGPIRFAPGADPTLEFAASTLPANPIEGFGPGDTLEITGFIATGSQVAGDALTLTGPDGTITLDVPDITGRLIVTSDSATDTTDVSAACYAEGTLIRTTRGEVAIERLVPGDEVVTLFGGTRPVRWIGRRHLACGRHTRPTTVWPVRVAAGALAAGLPARDLFLSPDHAVYTDGLLIPVRQLINGGTIRQLPLARVTYYHVELDRHDVVFAEDLPAETYRDTGNRASFENADIPVALHADFATIGPPGLCAVLATIAQAAQVWRRLARRAIALGHVLPTPVTTHDPRLRLTIGEHAVRPVIATATRATFALPPDARRVRLTSRTVDPSSLRPWLDDRRCLGVAVAAIRLHHDDAPSDIALDHPALGDGWHDIERTGGRSWRWTNGSARLLLPPQTRLITLRLVASADYPIESTPAITSTAAQAV